MESENVVVVHRVPWNKGKLTGQKPPAKCVVGRTFRRRLRYVSGHPTVEDERPFIGRSSQQTDR